MSAMLQILVDKATKAREERDKARAELAEIRSGLQALRDLIACDPRDWSDDDVERLREVLDRH